jgi:serine/threonine protein phosphatase 1
LKIQQDRTLIIGDIHGSFESLRGVLQLAKYNLKQDRLICLGDYIDGWVHSYEVVDMLIDCQENSPFDNIYLVGIKISISCTIII